jgi:hypothetical protein
VAVQPNQQERLFERSATKGEKQWRQLMYKHDEYADVPEHILGSLDRYAKTGGNLGGFLEAVISNDLFRAVGLADPDSMRALKKIVTYISCQLPLGCHGGDRQVKAWRVEHRI